MTAAMDHGQKPPRQRISMGPPPPPNMREDELDLFSIFRLIRRRILLIALVTFLLTLLQLPFIMEISQTYTSTARLLIHKPLTAALVGPAAEIYGPADPTTEVERLRATPIAERIIEEFGLDQMDEFNPPPAPPGLLSTIAQAVRGYLSSEPPGAPLVADPKNVVLSHYYESLAVYRSGISDVIEIAFTSENAGLAARIPNAIITVYLDELNGQIRGQLVKAKEWLSDRIETQRQRVEKMDEQARTMRQEQIASFKDAETALASRTVSLNSRQSEIMSERFKLQTTIDAINKASTLGEKAALIDTDRMVDLSQELQTLQGDLLEMRQTYGDNFSIAVKKRQAIDDIEARIQFEVDRNLRSLQTKVAALDTEALSIEKDIADARVALAKTSASENDLRVILESVDIERTALAVLEEQRRSLEQEVTLPVAEVEIITPATVARWPDGRSKKFYLLVGMIVSGMIGVTLAMLLDMLDSTVRSHQQLRGISGVVPAGLIPQMKALRGSLPLVRILYRQNALFLDAVSGLAMQIDRDRAAGPTRSILVTSAVPGEEVSTVATALAVHYASAGRGVLLVDLDRRSGGAPQSFGIAAGPALSSYLAGEVDLESVIQTDPRTGVDFIAWGERLGPAYIELHKVSRILELARERNQFVIFDGPPVLATSETARLATVSDRTLLVVEWGGTKKKLIELAIDKLREATSDEVLVTINKVNPRKHMRYGFKDGGVFTPELRAYHSA